MNPACRPEGSARAPRRRPGASGRNVGRIGHGDDGFALVAVIVLLVVVTTVVTGFTLAARSRLDLAADRLARDRLDLAADGLVAVVARDLSRGGEGGAPNLPTDGTPVACHAGDLAVLVRAQHQSGLVDLNAAGGELIGLALRSLGLSAAVAARSADAILAYRSPDPDDAARASAALTRDGLRGGRFAAVEELHGFVDLAGVPAKRLAATFTTASGTADVAGPDLPAGLATVLPRGPTPSRPYVSSEPARTGHVAVAVFLRAPDGTLGRAGRLVEIDADGPRRRARLSLPDGAPDAAAARPVPCLALIGVAATHLQGLSP